MARVSADGNALEAAAGPGGPMDGAGAGLPRGARVSRARAAVIARESALRNTGRRCEERRLERRRQLQTIRAIGAAGGPLLAPPEVQIVGDFVGLCLLIDFSDAPATISRDEVDRLCNQPGYNGFGSNGSVFDFYRDNSIGRCRYTNIVAPYYRAKRPRAWEVQNALIKAQDVPRERPAAAISCLDLVLVPSRFAHSAGLCRFTSDTFGLGHRVDPDVVGSVPGRSAAPPRPAAVWRCSLVRVAIEGRNG